MTKKILAQLRSRPRNVWDIFRNEDGYFHIEYSDGKSSKKLSIEPRTSGYAIFSITLMGLTALMLAFRSHMLPREIVLLMVFALLAFVGYLKHIANSPKNDIGIRLIFIIIMILCLAILGMTAKDIIEIIRPVIHR